MKWGSAKDIFEAYERGKHRRYTLLFAVNGGAFTVVELLVSRCPVGLAAYQIAWGMVLFTAIMFFDILIFGIKMRKSARQLEGGDRGKARWATGMFGLPGWLVLSSLSLLLGMGWAFASRASSASGISNEFVLSFYGSVGILGALLGNLGELIDNKEEVESD